MATSFSSFSAILSNCTARWDNSSSRSSTCWEIRVSSSPLATLSDAAAKNFNGLGNVVGKDICHQEADDDDERQNDKFVPNRRERQAGNEKRAGQALGLMVVPAFNEEEVFFAETVVFDVG